MALRGAVVVLSALLLVGCMGSDESGGGENYRGVLAERYPPLKESLDAAVEPCQAEDFPACRTHYARARDQAQMLLDALEDMEAPAGLEDADGQFRQGLRAVAGVLEQAVLAADAEDDEEMARLHAEMHEAGVDVNNPLGRFNDVLGLELKPH